MPYPLAAGRSSWKESLLAALPHLWIGISAAIIRFESGIYSERLSTLGMASLVSFVLVCLILMVYSWRHSWPLWSASWFFYAFWIAIIVLGYGISTFAEHAWVANAILILGGLAAMAVGYLFLFRYSRLHALLAGLFLMPVATQFELEAIPDNLEAVIAVLFAILAALAAIAIVRTQNWVQGVVFALLANLVAGLVLTYVSFYRAEIPNFYGDSFLEAFLAFAFYFALATALFIGPLIFWYGVDRFRRKNRHSQGGLV